MNGFWNPWSPGVNGNAVADYSVAWRHIHRIFEQVGARNVAWVWSPNVRHAGRGGDRPLRDVYPGNAYVDFVGIDGYNWGCSQPGTRWQTFKEIFDATLREVRALTRKPVIVSEVGSSERCGSKARWIQDFFAAVERRPYIVAVTWFNHLKETDWRVTSSPQAEAEFAKSVRERVPSSRSEQLRLLGVEK